LDKTVNIEKNITVPINESTARFRINNYFTQAGYQLIESQGRILTFKRGSKVGSWFPRNPSNLLSIAVVEVLEKGGQTQIKAEFEVKVTVKDESHFTDDFWQNEIKEFEVALLKDQYSPLKDKKLTQKTLIANFKSLGPSILYILIWGVISAVLTVIMINVPGTDNLDPYIVAVGVMAVAAAGTIFLVRFWKKRRKSGSKDSSL
jgi:hypothetical protein